MKLQLTVKCNRPSHSFCFALYTYIYIYTFPLRHAVILCGEGVDMDEVLPLGPLDGPVCFQHRFGSSSSPNQ